MEKQNKINRRNFLKTAGAVGLGSVLALTETKADPNEPNTSSKPEQAQLSQVPTRKLGKTGVKVSCLAIGAAFDTLEKQNLLRDAVQWGVNYWDTAPNYAGGNGQRGIGRFISKNPKVREQLFLAALSSAVSDDSKTIADVERSLQVSLQNMNTDYLDLYYGVYMMSDPAQLTDELKQWAKRTKERKLIRFFGVSTHKNMAQCLNAAAKLDWIDVIMTAYNFRLSHDVKMQAALDACYKADIGLTAMKTQAHGHWGGGRIGAEEDIKLVRHFQKLGFTEWQAKLKLVLEDRRFASACVGMENITILTSNVAAALDKTKLTQADMDVFGEYAKATCSGYCAGCAEICDSALSDMPYTSDIMRYLMYYNSYGQQERARELFAGIPADVRNKLLSIDYSSAEARCPQHIPISKLIAEAVSKLA